MTKSRIEELEDECAQLRYRLDEIEASMRAAEDCLLHIANLTPTERRILALLFKCGRRSQFQIEQHLYPGAINPPAEKSIYVFIHKLRLKLAPVGIEIRTIREFGYELTPASIAIIKRQPNVSNCMLAPAQLRAAVANSIQVRVEQGTTRHD
ncbi:MAG: helix-turn-helix domain-containing protein [Hyphomicrobium sp.]|nr:helix-turn-helix domain-containing protein [Hyphomicrobium sp.]